MMVDSSALRNRCSSSRARNAFRWPVPGSIASSARRTPAPCIRSQASLPRILPTRTVEAPRALQLPPPATQAPDVTLKLGVLAAQLKFDLEELTVAPGQLVEIVFVNSDQMQHNFLLGASGSLEEIGKAADTLAASPNAAAQQYVPEIPQVLYSTKLVDPGQTLRFQFKAPAQPGQYPYVCTFPGHWRLMNGILRVVAPAGRGGGGACSGGEGAVAERAARAGSSS